MSHDAPIPVPDRDTQPFWDGADEHRLLVPRCASCQRWIWQPRPVCPDCHALDPVWTEVDGSATVASWTVIHPPVLPVWAEETPFAIVLVELTQGVRMVGRLVHEDGSTRHDDEGVAMGAPLALRWRDTEPHPLPAWTLR